MAHKIINHELKLKVIITRVSTHGICDVVVILTMYTILYVVNTEGIRQGVHNLVNYRIKYCNLSKLLLIYLNYY